MREEERGEKGGGEFIPERVIFPWLTSFTGITSFTAPQCSPSKLPHREPLLTSKSQSSPHIKAQGWRILIAVDVRSIPYSTPYILPLGNYSLVVGSIYQRGGGEASGYVSGHPGILGCFLVFFFSAFFFLPFF